MKKHSCLRFIGVQILQWRIFYTKGWLARQGSDASAPLPGTRLLAGQGTMRFFGLEVYQARGCGPSPGFARRAATADQPLALAADLPAQLHRARRLPSAPSKRCGAWPRFGPAAGRLAGKQALQAALPDVKPGDTPAPASTSLATGATFKPGRPRVVGEVADA